MDKNEDLKYAMGWYHNTLYVMGVWPEPIASGDYRRPIWKFIVPNMMMICFMVGPQLINVINVWGDLMRMVDSFVSTILAVSAMCNLYVTWYHLNDLRTVIASIWEDWSNEKSEWERRNMLQIAKTSRSMSIRSYAATSMLYISYILVNGTRCIRNHSQKEKRNLMYRSLFPYDAKESPNYELTFFSQIYAATCAAFAYSTIDSFIIAIILHICGQIENLLIFLKNVVAEAGSEAPNKSFRKNLNFVVRRHDHLNRLANIVDSSYSASLLIQLLGAMFHLCFELFNFYLKVTNAKSEFLTLKTLFIVSYVATIVTHLHAYCYAGEKLTVQSTSMAFGVYDCNWYNLPAKDAKDLMMVVHRSTIPLRLSAGKFGTFSMQTFSATFKSAMGYLSVLLTVKEGKNV